MPTGFARFRAKIPKDNEEKKTKEGENSLQLLECHIVNFGCLSDRHYSFREGLNVLYAENGSGKSTLAVFLKAMLYGFAAVGKSNLVDNERKRYAPWNCGKFGGSLSFSARGKEYRVERFFGAREKDDTFKLYHLATQKESTDFDAKLGNALFGVDADGFERSLYVSQRAPFLPPKNNTIRARLGNLLDAAEDLGAFEAACKKLDTARRSYVTTGNRGRVEDLEREIQAKQAALAEAEAAKTRAEQLLLEAASLRKEKENALLSLNKAKENRALADKRRLIEQSAATYRRYCEAIDEEERALAPLNAFFDTHLPKDEALSQAGETLARLEGKEASLSFCHMSEEEEKELAALRAEYGSVFPQGELSLLRSAFASYEAAKKAKEENVPIQNSEFETLSLHFSEKEPSDEDIDALHKATAEYDNAEANLLVENELFAQKAKLPMPTLLCGIFSAILLVLGIVFFALSMSLLGGIGSGAAVALAFAAFLSRPPQSKRTAQGELQKAHAALSALLLPYRYTERSPSVCAKLLFKDLARFRAMREENERRSEAHKEACRKESELDAFLKTALSKHKKSGLSYADAIKAQEQDAEALYRLSKAEQACAERRAALSLQIKEEKRLLDAFLSPFEELLSLPYREAMTRLRERMLLLASCKARLKDAKEALASFLDESGFDPTAPMPPYVGESEALLGEEKLWSELVLKLETQATEKETEARYENESAAASPTLSAEIDALTAEKSDARRTYELLDAARNLLMEAKESLSSRYLSGIEGHFNKYLSLLSSQNEKYFFDTELSLTTERYGERKPIEVLSRGEGDLIAFCARLALIDSIFTEEVPFLLLDDPFVNLDDQNHERAFALLEKLSARFQIFYTVCSASRLGR